MPVTYAMFVAATVGGLTFAPAEPPSPFDEWEVRIGANRPGKDGPGKNGVVSLEWQHGRPWVWGLRPCAAIGAGEKLLYATACVSKPIPLGQRFTLAPSFGPTLLTTGNGAEELLQFRTSIQLQVKLQRDWRASVGMYHISNANITKESAGMDVFFASISKSF